MFLRRSEKSLGDKAESNERMQFWFVIFWLILPLYEQYKFIDTSGKSNSKQRAKATATVIDHNLMNPECYGLI